MVLERDCVNYPWSRNPRREGSSWIRAEERTWHTPGTTLGDILRFCLLRRTTGALLWYGVPGLWIFSKHPKQWHSEICLMSACKIAKTKWLHQEVALSQNSAWRNYPICRLNVGVATIKKCLKNNSDPSETESVCCWPLLRVFWNEKQMYQFWFNLQTRINQTAFQRA